MNLNPLTLLALALALIGVLIPTFGVAFAIVGSVFAFFSYRSSPLLSGMAIGISLGNSALMTPELLTMDLVIRSSLNEEVIKNSHGFLYWGMAVFHALIWVLAILFRSHGIPERYREALKREAELLNKVELDD